MIPITGYDETAGFRDKFLYDNDYDEFANEIPFLLDILQTFQFELLKYNLIKKDLAGTSAQYLIGSYVT